MTNYVLDTSVVIAALAGESENARKIIKKKVIFNAPQLLMYEAANVLRYKFPVWTEAESLYADFTAFPIKYASFNSEEMHAIIKMANDSDTTVYDTSFHYLARSLGCTLLTCDRNYFEKAKKFGSIELIS